MYEQMKKNSVESGNQLKPSEFVRFSNADGKGKRIMFVGNSITLHGIKEDIGWFNEWGMAASEKDKDYVHLVMKEISKKDSDAAFCICQVAEWERNYKNGSDTYDLFENAKKFNADVIIMRFIENCPSDDFDADVFKKEYEKLIDFLNGNKNAKVIVTSGFWKHPGDGTMEQIAKERNYPFVPLGDLGEADDMKAIGLFWHEGVANHPGDKGMEAIAKRILLFI